MRPGMSCAIEVLVEEIDDTLFVPVQSIFRRGKENLAFVEHGSASEERTVEVGRYNDRWVQVLSGLSEGEVVLLAPPSGFSRETQQEESAAPGTEPAIPGAPAPGASMAGPPGAGAERAGGERRGGEGEGERTGLTEGAAGGERSREGIDAARAKRFEGMSEEERAKAMESYRSRRGGDGSREGGRTDQAGKGG